MLRQLLVGSGRAGLLLATTPAVLRENSIRENLLNKPNLNLEEAIQRSKEIIQKYKVSHLSCF